MKNAAESSGSPTPARRSERGPRLRSSKNIRSLAARTVRALWTGRMEPAVGKVVLDGLKVISGLDEAAQDAKLDQLEAELRSALAAEKKPGTR